MSMAIPCPGGPSDLGSATPSDPSSDNEAACRAPVQALGAVCFERTQRHVRVELPGLWRACGSTPLRGGLVLTRRVVILNVESHGPDGDVDMPSPETTLEGYCRRRRWSGPSMGMMTAASMQSCRTAQRGHEGMAVFVVLTAGLTNARRAGDKADPGLTGIATIPPGTINIVAVTNANLADAAMVEAIMVMTEAKAAVLQRRAVMSPVSGLVATGTGTDSIALVCGEGPRVRWCGKHVVPGELFARAVMDALDASLEWYG